MYLAEFQISFIPMTLNVALRSHWSIYSRESKKINAEIARQIKIPSKPFKKIAITIERHSSGSLDRDNKFFTAKHILDNLVRLGVVENDTEENIDFLNVHQVKVKRGEPRILKCIVTEEI